MKKKRRINEEGLGGRGRGGEERDDNERFVFSRTLNTQDENEKKKILPATCILLLI